MKSVLRRVGTVVGGATAAVVLAAGPASAHFCYLVNPAAQSDAGRAGSNGWTAFSDLALQFLPGLCDEGIAILAEAGGVSPSTPILDHSVLANGTLRNGKAKQVPAVAYLGFEAIEDAIPSAFAACAER